MFYKKYLPGTLVPRATMVIAVILSLMRLKHPKWEAKSPITAVSKPIQQMDAKKAGQPFK